MNSTQNHTTEKQNLEKKLDQLQKDKHDLEQQLDELKNSAKVVETELANLKMSNTDLQKKGR